MSDVFSHAFACMGTVVTLHIVNTEVSLAVARDAAVARAKDWFRTVESACNRFDATSELRRLCDTTNIVTPVSACLFEAAQFALAVADASQGAFDPTVGARMESRGFDRDYRTGAPSRSTAVTDSVVTYRDVELDATEHTITLHKPLLLDLGAVAKGLAIDLAARELAELQHFMIDAGGDLFASGQNAQGHPWRVGVRHPREVDAFLQTIKVTSGSVCTSGDYERTGNDGKHHLLDARNRETAEALASVTVLAPSAMVADALATAAFALGPTAGLTFLESHDVEALLVTPSLERFTTRGWPVD